MHHLTSPRLIYPADARYSRSEAGHSQNPRTIFFAMWPSDFRGSIFPLWNGKVPGRWVARSLLGVGLLLAGLLPLRAGAQEVHLSETHTSPNPEVRGAFGGAVVESRDVDDDGTPDLLVGAPRESPGGTRRAGRAYLINGADGEVLRTFTSPNPEGKGRFGSAVAEVEDIDDDGTPDLLVGASRESPSGARRAGRAYLISGADGEVLRTFTSPNPERKGRFGSAVAEIRDLDDDGTVNLLVGAPRESPGGTRRAGRAYLIDGTDGEILRILSSPNLQEEGRFGAAVAKIGDLGSDGISDLLIGAPDESLGDTKHAGRAYLIDRVDGEILRTLTSPNPEVWGEFGSAVVEVGNSDGNGILGLLVGASDESLEDTNHAGRIYRFGTLVSTEKKASRLLSKRHPELVKPKGEFETTEAYKKRQQRAQAKKQEILEELRRKRKQKIRSSLTSITLSIQKVGTYNADKEIFPITIQDTTYEVEIPLDEARSFDENWQDAKVVGYKKLKEDLIRYRQFNLKIVHPVTGSRYPIGPQEEIDQKQVNPNKLPSTTASVTFTEPSGNNRLDGPETASVQVTVKNKGNGPARQVRANVQPSSHPHLSYPTSVSFGTVKADTAATERIEIQADRTISSSSVDLTFQFEEANGFAPSPVKLQFETQEFIPPELTVADVGINDSNGNGIIDPGELVEVTARIKNESQGRAKGVSAKVSFGKNVLATTETRQSFDLGDLGPGEHQDIQFSLLTNQQAESVPVTVDLTEKYGEFGKQDVKLPLAFDQPTDQITEVQVEGQETEVAVQSGEALSVDVETNIPTTPMDRPDAVAVVMGVRSYSSEGVPDVKYARRDARVMRQYLTQTLGFREENILPRNPDGRMTYAEMRTLIQQKLPSYVKEGSEIFVFYSGHGAPTTGENRQGYLIPSDTDPNFVSDANAYALKDFYTDLSDVGATSVTVVLDACFTGQAGSGEMMIKKASPAVLSVENPFLAIENGTAFLASSTEQVANWYPEKKHGMFTYFFLKGLKGAANQNGDRQLTVAEMERYLTDADDGVPYYSRRVHQRTQTPQIVARDKERVLVRYGE